MNMKLIKLNPNHYIIVDGSEIKEGDYCIMLDSYGNLFGQPQKYLGEKADHHLNKGLKKITHSTQPLEYTTEDHLQWDKIQPLSLLEVKELLGEVNVNDKAEQWIEKNSHRWSNNNNEVGDNYGSFKAGYNQSLEDNKDKKYTEEDVINIVKKSRETGLTAEYLILSRQPKTSWDIEIIDGKLKLK